MCQMLCNFESLQSPKIVLVILPEQSRVRNSVHFLFCRVLQFTGMAFKDYYYFLIVFFVFPCRHGKQQQLLSARDCLKFSYRCFGFIK